MFARECSVKLLLEIPQKCCQNASETLSGSRNFQTFSGGACPQTPPRWAVGLCPQHNHCHCTQSNVWAPPLLLPVLRPWIIIHYIGGRSILKVRGPPTFSLLPYANWTWQSTQAFCQFWVKTMLVSLLLSLKIDSSRLPVIYRFFNFCHVAIATCLSLISGRSLKFGMSYHHGAMAPLPPWFFLHYKKSNISKQIDFEAYFKADKLWSFHRVILLIPIQEHSREL